MFKSNSDSNRFLQLTNGSSNHALVMYTILFARKSSSCIRTEIRQIMTEKSNGHKPIVVLER